MSAANVKSPEWRHMARAILTSNATPLVLFEFQLDLIKDDHFTKLKRSRYVGMPKQERGCHILRADAIAFDPWAVKNGKGQIRILEIKSGRADFKADDKWEKYLPYCTQFAFLAPDDAIKPDELPAGVGLFVPRLVQHKYKWDAVDGSYKAGDLIKEVTEPAKVKQWAIRKAGVDAARREVIKSRLVSRGIALAYTEQHKAEKMYYGCDPDFLKALEQTEKAA